MPPTKNILLSHPDAARAANVTSKQSCYHEAALRGARCMAVCLGATYCSVQSDQLLGCHRQIPAGGTIK